MYRLRILEQTPLNRQPLWSDYEKFSGVVYEEEDINFAFLEMRHLLNIKPILQVQIIEVVDVDISISVPETPIEPTP